jgi:hypothetical protein
MNTSETTPHLAEVVKRLSWAEATLCMLTHVFDGANQQDRAEDNVIRDAIDHVERLLGRCLELANEWDVSNGGIADIHVELIDAYSLVAVLNKAIWNDTEIMFDVTTMTHLLDDMWECTHKASDLTQQLQVAQVEEEVAV